MITWFGYTSVEKTFSMIKWIEKENLLDKLFVDNRGIPKWFYMRTKNIAKTFQTFISQCIGCNSCFAIGFILFSFFAFLEQRIIDWRETKWRWIYFGCRHVEIRRFICLIIIKSNDVFRQKGWKHFDDI